MKKQKEKIKPKMAKRMKPAPIPKMPLECKGLQFVGTACVPASPLSTGHFTRVTLLDDFSDETLRID